MKKLMIGIILMMLLPTVLAEDMDDDPEIFGLELEKLLNLGTGLLATLLAVVTFIAYRRTANKRLMFVSSAFVIFAVKGFLTSLELFMEEITWIDPMASALNFVIILLFFFGVMKK